jgi:two-component system OmpR family sensor kinase
VKGRLFWKIFAAFFLAFLAQVSAMFYLLNRVFPDTPKVELSDYRALQENALALRSALNSGGFSDVDKQLFGSGAAPLAIRELGDSEKVNVDPEKGRVATSRSGVRYLVEYHSPTPKPRKISIPTAQVYVNVIGFTLGVIFASALALYLSRPIKALRTGLDAFAAGNLRVRLGDMIGKRRDEISDLARDFDGMADKVEHLINTREQLLNDVSHELRTPLTRLRLAIALARQRPEKTAAALDRVESEAKRLDEMVDELLTLSRMESGAADLQGHFDLLELMQKLIADARFESGSAAQVKFEAFFDADVPANNSIHNSILGNAELIRRAIENVVRNAIRFSPDHGTISISLTQAANQASILIEDEGPGVSDEALTTLFEPFVKGGSDGFGLGLAIARRAVLAHGGSIYAENRKPAGLRVTIRLPTWVQS